MCVRVCVCVCVCVCVRVRACSWGAPAWCQIPDGWKRGTGLLTAGRAGGRACCQISDGWKRGAGVRTAGRAGGRAWCQIPDGWKRKSPGRNVTYKQPQSCALPDAPHGIPRRTVSHIARYPTPHGIPRRTVSHAARYPTPHGIPRRTVSHTARYPTPHGIPRGTVTHAATSSISASAVGDDLNAGCPPSAMPSAKSELLSAAPTYRQAAANAAVHTVSAAQRVHVYHGPAAAPP
jgi:hypothetical protein